MAKRASKISSFSSSSDGASLTVGFRLDTEHQHALLTRAKALDVSHHALARDYVERVLAEPMERAALHQEIVALNQKTTELRDGIVSLATELGSIRAGLAAEVRDLSGVTHAIINILQSRTAALRSDLALATEALLAAAGKVSEQEAEAWIKENFKTEEPNGN